MNAEKPAPPSNATASPGRWEHDSLGGLPCRILLPHDYQPARYAYPLVLFLHGSEERGSDNEAQLRLAVRQFNTAYVRSHHPAIVVAPQAPAGANWGGTWYGGSTPTQEAAIAIARALATRSSVDAGRIYLVGISMGAIGGWDILARAPGLFAGALLVCGDPDPDNAEGLRDVPIWSLHGDADDVVRPDNDREIARRVAALGGRLRYTELAGVGHEAWTPVFAEGEIYQWLFAQRLDAAQLLSMK